MKFLKIAFPVIIILFFILIMNVNFIFHPFIKSVPEKLNAIEEQIIHGEWENANITTNKLMSDIKKNKLPWLQFSIEREEINTLLNDIYLLKGSIRIMDTPSAIGALYGIKASWNNLGS